MSCRVVFALVISSFALSIACGDETDDLRQEREEQRPSEREGPEGCYIGSRRMCDCELTREECTEDIGTWTSGCASCAS